VWVATLQNQDVQLVVKQASFKLSFEMQWWAIQEFELKQDGAYGSDYSATAAS
jgi:hypothetical protein